MVSSALLLVCTGVNTGMGGVLRWLGGGSFWRLDLEERSRGISLHSGVETNSRSSCGGDFKGEREVRMPRPGCSCVTGALESTLVPDGRAVLPQEAAKAGVLGKSSALLAGGEAPVAAGGLLSVDRGGLFSRATSADAALGSAAKGLATEKA